MGEAPASSGRNWLPVGEEPLAPHNITHLTILRHRGLSVVCEADGDIDAGRPELASTGLYYQDTRYLSRLLASFCGLEAMLLDAREVEGVLSAIFTNPAMRSETTGAVIPAQSLVLRRRRTIDDCLVESISVSNYGLDTVQLDLCLEFEMDFADIFEVRGFERISERGTVRRTIGDSSVHFSCMGSDGVERGGAISFQPPPVRLGEGSAEFELSLGPRETFSIDLQVAVGVPHRTCTVARSIPSAQSQRRSWLSRAAAFECDNDSLNTALGRALSDLYALRSVTDGHEYVAAGVPWYDTLFGRDSIITGLEMLAWDPTILRSSLEVLAHYQADVADPVHDALPGKIPHELRWGELANTGELPFGRYYGSVDVTPLFIYAASQYYGWTGDLDFIRDLWPSLERAMGWCEEQMRNGVEGLLDYSRVSSNGLENQGWKDSHDAIVWPDGSLVNGPIALIEVQGYMAAALAAYGNLGAALGNDDVRTYGSRAAEFAEKVDALFADPALGYVLCLDGHARRVPTVASNACHMLWCGVARPELARRLAIRMLDPDMFSGWGVRTLSSTIPRYNPLGYHVGSVWPHDNALFLAGLRHYGLDDLADRLASSLLQAAVSFPDFRVPELFSGDARDLRLVPTPYPVASRPQAWSAASIPYIITSMLGVHPGSGSRQLAVIRPRLPMNLSWVRLRNLRYRGGAVDLAFRRSDGHVAVEVEAISGGIEIVLSQEGAAPAALQGQ